MKYKIIIFDIGGTLFDKKTDNKVPEIILTDIQRLKTKNIKVGVCSMRTMTYCREVAPIDFDFYICLNGSLIVCDEQVIFDCPLNGTPNATDYLTYGKETAYYSSTKAKLLANENGFIAQDFGESPITYNFVLFNIEQAELLNYSGYHYEYWSKTKALMLQNKNSSKVIGIAKVLEYYKISKPILYFGDGPNDLEIFQTYSDCVCMGSCYPPLEKYAIFKTETCQNNGISTALRKLRLL